MSNRPSVKAVKALLKVVDRHADSTESAKGARAEVILKHRQWLIVRSCVCAAALSCLELLAPGGADAETLREDSGPLAARLKQPIYEWYDPNVRPRAVVVAVHGLLQHGLTFDVVARELADRGFHVIAPDLRGSGRWYEGKQFSQAKRIDCRRSEGDLIELLRTVKSEHPDLPVIAMGESLGACFVVQIAAREPSLMHGAILSSPAIKVSRKLYPSALCNLVLSVLRPGRKINLASYFRKYTGNDNRVIEEKLSDPLVRKSIVIKEALCCNRWNKRTLKAARLIPPDIPVLIIQASSDPLLRERFIRKLALRLETADKTVKRIEQVGHVFLQTKYVRADTIATVNQWLESHTRDGTLTSQSGGGGL